MLLVPGRWRHSRHASQHERSPIHSQPGSYTPRACAAAAQPTQLLLLTYDTPLWPGTVE